MSPQSSKENGGANLPFGRRQVIVAGSSLIFTGSCHPSSGPMFAAVRRGIDVTRQPSFQTFREIDEISLVTDIVSTW